MASVIIHIICFGILIYCSNADPASEIAAECEQCTSRGYHYYRVGHVHMNDSFVCFDYRHLFLVDTVIYDRALDRKECGNFYSRLNTTKVKNMRASAMEIELLMEFGERLTRKTEGSSCVPPIICFFLGVVLSVFGPQAYFFVKRKLGQAKQPQVPILE